jgi:hypothetical protein
VFSFGKLYSVLEEAFTHSSAHKVTHLDDLLLQDEKDDFQDELSAGAD